MKLESYVRPAGLDEALAALAEPGVKPLVVAGGTDLVPMMRKMRMNGTLDGDDPRVVLDLSKLDDLCGIREAGDMLEIGAATTMGAIVAHPSVKELVPVLAAAAATVGSPLVRNRATVGGNLVTASPSADTAPALLAAGAVVRLAGAAGGVARAAAHRVLRRLPQDALLQPGEIVTHVLIPLAGRPVAGRFEKVGLRNADAISVVCAACEIELDGSTCRAARIGLGAVAAVPVRALAVEAALRGREITEDVAAECARLVHEHIAPIDDVRASAQYRGSGGRGGRRAADH